MNRYSSYFQIMRTHKHFNPENSGAMETMTINTILFVLITALTLVILILIFVKTFQMRMCSVIQNYEPKWNVIFTSTFEDDDKDGVPNALEFDGDTDGDGIEDYKDNDDDGDNVPTLNERPDPNNDGDLSDAQDTDGDGTPDYLDMDDDGDGTLHV